MHMPGIVVLGVATVTDPTGTVPLRKRAVKLPAAEKTGGANISLQNKFV